MTISVSSFKMRFPEFEASDDSAIQFALDEASSFVDDTWITNDAVLAQMYLAAHSIAVSEASADVGGRTIVSESIGIISASYGTAQTSSSDGSALKRTSYGERYLSLLRRNHPPVAII